MNKTIEAIGKPLSRTQLKQVVGGYIPCTYYTQCPDYCTGDMVYGNSCIQGKCMYVMCP